MTYPEDDKEILAREEAKEWQTRALKAEAKVEWFERWAEQVDRALNIAPEDCGFITPMDLLLWESENPKP